MALHTSIFIWFIQFVGRCRAMDEGDATSGQDLAEGACLFVEDFSRLAVAMEGQNAEVLVLCRSHFY